MKKKLFAALLFAGLALPTLASAQVLPVGSRRCTYDQLYTNTDAQNRRNWATNWYAVNPYQWAWSNGKDPRFFDSPMFQKLVSDYITTYGIQLYPVYSDPDTLALWKPSKKLVPADNYTYKPAPISNDAVCEPGCYTPEQNVLFSSGYVPIAKAWEGKMTDVMTLTPESTFDALSFFTNQVVMYTYDDHPADQEILVFHTQSGGELQVTTRHPIVAEDGSMRAAEDFHAGDSLVREDGSPDVIVSIEMQKMHTQTFNLRPATTDLLSNIVVAQGFLNGSARYQSEYVEELNRILLRHNVPADIVPEN